MSCGLFLFFGFLLLRFISEVFFIDEFDNFVGGMLVAAGQDVYKVHISQHMPFMYYLCAIFRLFGASSVYAYRLGFYAFLSILWVAMYARYHRHFGKTLMILYPVLYIFEMATAPQTPTALSDQLQAQGAVILLMEFLLFSEKRDISLSSCLWVSLAVVFTFGTTFVSIYGIFLLIAGLLIVQAYHRKQYPLDPHTDMRYFMKRFSVLSVIVALPFALLILWYLISGNLRNFYDGAYAINVHVYSKYISGFGAKPILAIVSTVDAYFSTFIATLRQLLSDPQSALHALILFYANFAFLLLLLRRHWLYSAVVALFVLANGTRGFSGFHALSYYSLSVWMLAFVAVNDEAVIKWWKGKGKSKVTRKVILFACVIAIISTPYFSRFSAFLSAPELLTKDYTKDPMPAALQKITAPDEKIFITTFALENYIHANRLPMMYAPSCVPWLYDMYKKQQMETMWSVFPRVVVYSPDWEVWGYQIKDYAPEFVQFMTAKYTQIKGNGLDNLFVRNDYVEEARQLLDL